MCARTVSLDACVRLSSARDFAYAFLIVTENGIEDAWDAEYALERRGDMCSRLWEGVSAAAQGQERPIGDFYPLIADVWSSRHWDDATPPLKGEYRSAANSNSVATFDVDVLGVTLANFGRERRRETVQSVADILSRGDVRYMALTEHGM